METLIDRRLIDEALGSMLSPAQMARLRAYRARREAVASEHGEAFAALWGRAQPWLAHDGRVKSPPSGWAFVVAMPIPQEIRAAEHLSTEQLAHWRSFWAWYQPVEAKLRELGILIVELHEHRERDEKLFRNVCAHAYPIVDRYMGWLRDGTIQWLPLRRGWEPDRNIVENVHALLIKLDSGPEPAPAWDEDPF